MFIVWLILLMFSFGLMLSLSIHEGIGFSSFVSDASDKEDVSVIVVLKNEETRLPNLISDLRKQRSAHLTFLLVDDHSTDTSPSIIQKVCSEDERFRSIRYSSELQGKKAALSAAIDHCRSELIILTDADCRVLDPDFVMKMTKALSAADLVVGSSLVLANDSWLSKVYGSQTLRQHLLFHAAVNFGIPFMAVGRSMALRRSAFISVGGMSKHLTHPSGTDDLLLQDFVHAKRKVISCPDAITLTTAPRSWQDWISQRGRHLSVGDQYPPSALLLIWLFEWYALLFPLTCLFNFLISPMSIPGIFAFFLLLSHLFLTDIISMQFLDAARVDSKRLHLRMADLVVCSVNALISTLAVGRMHHKWKTRK